MALVPAAGGRARGAVYPLRALTPTEGRGNCDARSAMDWDTVAPLVATADTVFSPRRGRGRAPRGGAARPHDPDQHRNDRNSAGARCRAAEPRVARFDIRDVRQVDGPRFTENDDLVLGPTSRSRWSYAASKIIEEFLGPPTRGSETSRSPLCGSSTPSGRARPDSTGW